MNTNTEMEMLTLTRATNADTRVFQEKYRSHEKKYEVVITFFCEFYHSFYISYDLKGKIFIFCILSTVGGPRIIS